MNKLPIFSDYISWLTSKLNELMIYNQKQDIFRIVDIINKKCGACLLKIQVVGKATIFECAPQEIISNDKLLEGFSKKDVSIITYLACKSVNKPKYHIIVQEFCEKLNKTIFKLGKRGEAKPLKLTADQISLDKKLLNDLSQADAHLVGYITGSEQILSEKENIIKLSNNESI